MLKTSHAGCLDLSPTILLQFTVEMCVAAKNCKKIHQNPLFWGSRSSTFTNPKSPSPVLVMICSKSVPICKRFHTIRANSGKTASFYLTQRHKILSLKTRVLEAAHSEDFVILACTVSIQITSVTDRQKARRTDV